MGKLPFTMTKVRTENFQAPSLTFARFPDNIHIVLLVGWRANSLATSRPNNSLRSKLFLVILNLLLRLWKGRYHFSPKLAAFKVHYSIQGEGVVWVCTLRVGIKQFILYPPHNCSVRNCSFKTYFKQSTTLRFMSLFVTAYKWLVIRPIEGSMGASEGGVCGGGVPVPWWHHIGVIPQKLHHYISSTVGIPPSQSLFEDYTDRENF